MAAPPCPKLTCDNLGVDVEGVVGRIDAPFTIVLLAQHESRLVASALPPHVGVAADGLVGNGQVLEKETPSAVGRRPEPPRWPQGTSVSPSARGAHLLHGIKHAVVETALSVDGVGVVRAVHVVLQEEVLEGDGVLLLERHHHLVAEPKEDELEGQRGPQLNPWPGSSVNNVTAQNAVVLPQNWSEEVKTLALYTWVAPR